MSLVILTGASLVVGCAAQAPPVSTGTSAGREGVAAAPAAPPTLVTSSQTATAQLQPSTSQTASAASGNDDDATRGYQRVVVQGTELFCRREAEPGTRITNKVCRTRAEVEAQQEAARQYIDAAQRNSGATGTGQPAGPY